jgi:hypothetical protein
VAVSPVLDPLAELQRGHGRFLCFAPDEIEPLAADAPRTCPAVSAGQPVTPSRGGTTMVGKLIKAALLATLLAVVVQSLPDVQRHLELREM